MPRKMERMYYDKCDRIGIYRLADPALMSAAHGNEVVGTDYNAAIVEKLQAGELSFEEKGLPELFQSAVASGIQFTTAYQKTDLYIVAVPTPYDKASKRIDPRYVVGAVQDVMQVCPKGATVVVESTITRHH